MFKELENIPCDDLGFLLVDEIGEKVFGRNLKDDYESIFLANHVANLLNIIKRYKKFAEIEFLNITIFVCYIDEYKAFFISKSGFDANQKLKMLDIAERIKNILEV